MKQLVTGSFCKFAVVGSIGFIINTTILEVLVHTGFHPALGSGFGAELAIISNFLLNNSWTFQSRKVHGFPAIVKFLQFNITSLGAVLIQSGTVWLGSISFGVSVYRWFYLLGVGIGLLWNYMMYSKVIWKNKENGHMVIWSYGWKNNIHKPSSHLTIQPSALFIAVILLVAAYLRLHNISGYMTF